MLALPAMQEWQRDALAEVEALQRAPTVARTPAPPAPSAALRVLFSSQRTTEAAEEYETAAQAMVELASKQPREED